MKIIYPTSFETIILFNTELLKIMVAFYQTIFKVCPSEAGGGLNQATRQPRLTKVISNTTQNARGGAVACASVCQCGPRGVGDDSR